MSDLIERLREIAEPDTYIGDNNEKEVCALAADRIQDLEAEKLGSSIRWGDKLLQERITRLESALKRLGDINPINPNHAGYPNYELEDRINYANEVLDDNN